MYSGIHWTTRQEMADYAHKSVLEALAKMKWTPYKAKVFIHVFSYAKSPLDPDNICDKMIIDGLKHAGVIVNDTKDQIKYVITEPKKAKKDYTEIHIEKCT